MVGMARERPRRWTTRATRATRATRFCLFIPCSRATAIVLTFSFYSYCGYFFTRGHTLGFNYYGNVRQCVSTSNDPCWRHRVVLVVSRPHLAEPRRFSHHRLLP